MSLLMLLAAGGGVSYTETYTSNTTWVAPGTTLKLDGLTGCGASGEPGSTGVQEYYTVAVYLIFARRDGTTQGSLVSSSPTHHHGEAPPNEAGDFIDTPDSTIYYGYYYYTEYSGSSGETTIPATTGASTTGFGKTFTGGTGGSATPVNYANVVVTPGASYSLVIPSGGSISITYIK